MRLSSNKAVQKVLSLEFWYMFALDYLSVHISSLEAIQMKDAYSRRFIRNRWISSCTFTYVFIYEERKPNGLSINFLLFGELPAIENLLKGSFDRNRRNNFGAPALAAALAALAGLAGRAARPAALMMVLKHWKGLPFESHQFDAKARKKLDRTDFPQNGKKSSGNFQGTLDQWPSILKSALTLNCKMKVGEATQLWF